VRRWQLLGVDIQDAERHELAAGKELSSPGFQLGIITVRQAGGSAAPPERPRGD
jgi:hypothetical protein